MKFYKTKKIFLNFSIILGMSVLLLSADSTIEELEKKLQSVSGKDRVPVLNDIAKAYWDSSPEKVFAYASQALELAQKFDLRKEQSRAYTSIAVSHSMRGEFVDSIRLLHQTLEISEELDDWDGVLRCLINLGLDENELGAFENSGLVQKDMGHHNNALDYFQRALELAEKEGTKEDMATLWLDIGITYGHLEKYDLALTYLEKSLDYSEKTGDKKELASCYSAIGWLYGVQESYEKAQEFFLKELEIHRQINNPRSLILALNNVGAVYNELHNHEKAQQYLEEGLALAKEMEATQEIIPFAMNLSLLFTAKEDYKKALEYYELYYDTKDEIVNEQKNQEIAALQVKYETAQKEKEIEIKELALARQRTIRNFLAGIAGLVLILASVTYNRYRFKAKTNKELTSLNELIRKENQAKDKLFSIIAHDLSSPLNGLLFCSEYLKNNFVILEKEKVKEVLDELAEYTINISDLLKNLLRWAVSQLREISCNPRETDLTQVRQKKS